MLATFASETVKLKDSTRCLLDRPADGYNREIEIEADQSRGEAASNTSTVTLRVVGGDEKGSLESETVKMVASSTELGPKNDYAGEGQQQL
jgi:hypothetical protein